MSFNIAVKLEVYLKSLVAHLTALLWTSSTFLYLDRCEGTKLLKRTPTEVLQGFYKQHILATSIH